VRNNLNAVCKHCGSSLSDKTAWFIFLYSILNPSDLTCHILWCNISVKSIADARNYTVKYVIDILEKYLAWSRNFANLLTLSIKQKCLMQRHKYDMKYCWRWAALNIIKHLHVFTNLFKNIHSRSRMTFRLALLLVTFVDLDSYMYIVVFGRRYCTS